MSRLAEEIVEEWLNRQRYFTIRGIRIGVDEIDMLAIRWQTNDQLECRHIEVQASSRPVSCISKLPKQVQKATGRGAGSAKRTDEELRVGVKEWVERKYLKPSKKKLMDSLAPGPWSMELVVHKVKLEDELDLIRGHGIQIIRLAEVIRDLSKASPIESACGNDLLELVQIGSEIA